MATGQVSRLGMVMHKLWTNNSLSSAFSAQTLGSAQGVDLTDYDAVLISFVVTITDTDSETSLICLKDGNRNALSGIYPSKTTIYSRGVTVSNNGVQFYGGYEGATSGKNGSCVPHYIYGIKGL